MDDYQKFVFVMLKQDCAGTCSDCWNSQPVELSPHLLQAVENGDIDLIKDYIDKDGDVNAVHKGECLLSRACAVGQPEIVKMLLGCSGIHVNQCFNYATPIMRAAWNGHLECVRILLDTRVKCLLLVQFCWESIAKCLKMPVQFQYSAIVHILRFALQAGICHILQLILETEHHFEKRHLYPITLHAVNQNQWDIVYAVFKRDFCGKNEVINEVFAITVNMRNWQRAREVMHYMDTNLKFDVGFVEAAIAGRIDEVQRLLTTSQYDSQMLNGNLLVVAAGGIDDPVAEMLMGIKDVYSEGTFSKALFLAALGYRIEIFLGLLHNPEASYSFNDFHQTKDVLTRLPCYSKRNGYLVTYFNHFISRKSWNS